MDPRLTNDALALLKEDFDTFDTALQKDPKRADGQVSKADLQQVLQGRGYSASQRAAARVLLENDFAFFRHDTAGASPRPNGLIDVNNLNRSLDGQGVRKLQPQQYRDLADSFLQSKLEGVDPNDLYAQNWAITEAYAQLYASDPNLKWAGMAAFASDRVGTGIWRSDAGNWGDIIDWVPGANGAVLEAELGSGNRKV